MLDRSIKIKQIAIDLFLTYLRRQIYTFVYRISTLRNMGNSAKNEFVITFVESVIYFFQNLYFHMTKMYECILYYTFGKKA